ncbi:hypothetical protein ABEG63_05035 [Chryseobacterium sp. C39-AII1]|uniref:hypothetical protein n=1 Tax=Chryseobacterium sp. C39-AII1 TaxID=3080332 RepID=UPI00320A8BB2
MDILMSKKEILRRLNTLRIKPEEIQQRKYGVSVKYFTNDEQIPSKRVDYDIVVDLQIEGHKGFLILNKENILYDQHPSDSMSEILSDAISRSFYPIKTHINEKGISSNEIINHDEIKERWIKERSKILEKYSGASLTDFFLTVDKKLDNKANLEKNLQHDWFWNLFFHPKFIDYGETRKAEIPLYLSVIPYKPPLKFNGTQTIHKIPTNYHSFQIDFQSDEQTAAEYFIPKNGLAQHYFMSLKVIFDVDLYHHFPMHIQAYFEVYAKDWNGNKIFVKRINYTQFQENTEQFKDKELDKNSPFITGGLVVSEPNKWGFYKNEYENDW